MLILDRADEAMLVVLDVLIESAGNELRFHIRGRADCNIFNFPELLGSRHGDGIGADYPGGFSCRSFCRF